ncbi:MAG: EamA family transporter [Chloroflexi bacterium]|nr:EamA family transporter [Chloroflexota bacterium]
MGERLSPMRSTVGRSHPIASRLQGYGLVALGAALWGSLGLFYQVVIGRYGLTSLETVFWRALIASGVLALLLARRDPGALRVARRDLGLMALLGAVGVAATFWIYAYAIRAVGMGVAAVLQYVAPVWVTLFSVCFWGERIAATRMAALVLAVAGVALVGRIWDLQGTHLSLLGIAAALATSLTYAAYVLLIKMASGRGYGSGTILLYGLCIGTLCLAPLQTRQSLNVVFGQPGVIPWLIALGVVTLAAGLSFNAGLKHVPASNASIVATIEPLTAMLLGRSVLNERLEFLQVIGALCILAAVSVLQIRSRRRTSRSFGQFEEQNIAPNKGT